MARSVLNDQQSRQANRGLYFVLGLLSLSQSLENTLDQAAVDTEPNPEAPPVDENQDFLYFTLGALSFSHQLQERLGAEWELTDDKNTASRDTPHTPPNLMD
jgi:hypothetical protein